MENKVLKFEIVDGKVIISVDPNKDGKILLSISLDMADVPAEVISIFAK
jgi:hypothetical protein